MPDAREHAAIVLSAIIPGRLDRLQKANRVLVPEHFEDKYHRGLYSYTLRYLERTGGIPDVKAIEDLTRTADPGQAQIYVETYSTFVSTEVGEESFLWSLEQLRELYSERRTMDALTEAVEVLKKGIEVDGEVVRGAEASRSQLSLSLSQIDRDMTMQEAPEGDVRVEREKTMAEYARRKAELAEGKNPGILFGIEAVDAKINGLQRGEVVMLAGASGDGKTSLLVQLAWNAAIMQGKNVVFYTTETLRDQVRDRLIARHSRHPKFGLHRGINSADIRNACIPEDLEEAFAAVVDDFEKGEGYGKLWVKQVPRGAGLNYIEQSLSSLERKFQVDLVGMDYVALLAPERKRGSTREELAQTMKDTKQVATGHAGGRGVPFVTPWQVTRSAREMAADRGMYVDGSLSETAESVNSADVIVSMLAPIDNTEATCAVHMQILKNRSGPSANNINVLVDYSTSHFGAAGSGGTTHMLPAVPGSRRGLSADPIDDILFD